MNCPKCSGEMWDERLGKFWGNGLTPNGKNKPTHKCKDKDCAKNGGVAWEKVSGAASGGNGGAVQSGLGVPPKAAQLPASSAPATASGHELYSRITKWVIEDVVPMYVDAGIPVDASAVAAMSATLFINASKNGH